LTGEGWGGGEKIWEAWESPGGETFEIHFRRGESIEQGRSSKEYIFQAYMKRLPAMADNNGGKDYVKTL